MSNNIYDIMQKLNAVASKDTLQSAKKADSSTLLESTMKEVLNEKYMGFDKTVDAIKKGGSAKDPEAVAASIGRKKYGKEKFQAAAAKGKKLGEDSHMSEDDMEEGNKFTGNLAKARAQGKKRADLDGDGDMETVREGAKPDYIDLDKDGNRKESMKKAAADKKKRGVAEGSILKSIRRGLQGWGGGVTPAGIKKRSSEYSDDELRSMSAGHDELRRVRASTPMPTEVPKHSPAGLQKRVLDREMKKRGLGEEGVAEAKADPTSTWVVYDGDKVKRFKTHQGAKAYAEQHGGKVASSAYYADKIQGKKDVAEGTKETSTGRVHKAEPGGYGRKDDEDDDKKKEKKAEPAVKRGRGRPKKNADSDTGEVKKWDTDTLQSWIVGSVPKKLPGKASVKHKIKDEPDEKLDEKAPPGAKAERMVKHIKKGYEKDGNLTDKEKGIAYATAWKAKKAGKVEESIPPRFPRDLAKKIYEHCGGNMQQALTAMWKVHNTVMESKKKLDESMTFEQSTTKPQQKPVMGTIKGGVWTADPPQKGEQGVPVPQDIDGGSAAPTKPTKKPTKEDVSENKELNEVLKLAGVMEESVKVDECGMSQSPIAGAYAGDMQDTEGRMNISTNMSTDGNKTVTITADGDAAVELMQMLKMAGMNSMVDKNEDTDNSPMSEEKDDRYEANTTPEEEVLPVQVQTKGGNGEVAGKEKKMTPHGYKFADNPLAMGESMSLKLMKEYESIKKIV